MVLAPVHIQSKKSKLSDNDIILIDFSGFENMVLCSSIDGSLFYFKGKVKCDSEQNPLKRDQAKE